VKAGISEKAVFKIQHVGGGIAARAQNQMFIAAIWPEVHDAVMDYGNGRVLNKDAEHIRDVVREWLVGDHARRRASQGSKQS
jgi:hypothetical protein